MLLTVKSTRVPTVCVAIIRAIGTGHLAYLRCAAVGGADLRLVEILRNARLQRLITFGCYRQPAPSVHCTLSFLRVSILSRVLRALLLYASFLVDFVCTSYLHPPAVSIFGCCVCLLVRVISCPFRVGALYKMDTFSASIRACVPGYVHMLIAVYPMYSTGRLGVANSII